MGNVRACWEAYPGGNATLVEGDDGCWGGGETRAFPSVGRCCWVRGNLRNNIKINYSVF